MAAKALTPSDTGTKFSNAARGQEVAEPRNAYISVMKLHGLTQTTKRSHDDLTLLILEAVIN